MESEQTLLLHQADKSFSYKRRLESFCTSSVACETYAVVALSFFVPVTLEQFARDNGRSAFDHSQPCATACEAKVLWSWINTASFSLFTYSCSVATLAIMLVSLGDYADSLVNRRRLLFRSALTGSSAGLLIFAWPSTHNPLWFLVSPLALVSGVSYGLNALCLNAALPELGRNSPEAGKCKAKLATADTEDERFEAEAMYHTAVSARTAAVSATSLAMGYGSGLVLLASCLLPLKKLHGSTFSLRLSIGIAAFFWLVLATTGFLLAPRDSEHHRKRLDVRQSWVELYKLIKEASKLKQVFKFLLAWVFLSDGFATITSASLLFAKSDLNMPSGQVLLIGLIVPFCMAVSTIAWQKAAAYFRIGNLKMLVTLCLLASLVPVYACLGFIPSISRHGGIGSLRNPWEMFSLAGYFGCLYGSFQSYARAVYAELLPPRTEARLFALYGITNKSASFLGPLLVGLAGQLSGSLRGGFIVILACILLPLPLLASIDMKQGRQDAHRIAVPQNLSHPPG